MSQNNEDYNYGYQKAVRDYQQAERQELRDFLKIIAVLFILLIGGGKLFEFWIMNPNTFGAKQTNQQEEVRR